MTFLKIAWRNVWRNKRRTIIAVAAVAFSLFITILTITKDDGIHDAMMRNMMKYFHGYLQIHKAGYNEDPNVEKAFVLTPEIIEKIEAAPNVSGWSPRLQTGALVGSDSNSMGGLIVGVDPEKEKRITVIHEKIIKGDFLSGKSGECIIGEKMAKNLNMGVGDKLVIITSGIDGSTGALKFTVKGLFRMGSDELERSLVFINIEDARELVLAKGMVTGVAIVTDSTRNIYPAVEFLKEKLPDRDKYEVLGWKELMPGLVSFIYLDGAIDYVFLTLLVTVVVFGVLSVVFSSILERTREFGIMLALGTSPGQIISLVMIETFFITLTGMIVGLILGVGLSWHYVQNPIVLNSNMTEMMAQYGMENKIYFAIYPLNIFYAVIGITFLSFAFSLLPAWKASKLKPDQAIRNINN